MNALNVHRHSFPLSLVSQVFASVGVEIPRNNVSNLDVVATEHFNNGVVAGFYFDDEETVFRIDENHSAIHMGTSNVLLSGAP